MLSLKPAALPQLSSPAWLGPARNRGTRRVSQCRMESLSALEATRRVPSEASQNTLTSSMSSSSVRVWLCVVVRSNPEAFCCHPFLVNLYICMYIYIYTYMYVYIYICI
ncbi:unnamed protein product, partial [Musa acuminata subsp. burmannicoides]